MPNRRDAKGEFPWKDTAKGSSTVRRGGGGGSPAFQAEAIRRTILAIPAGKVRTYGDVADIAGYPGASRAVARLLREEGWDLLPWHRVVGAKGELKTRGSSLEEQRNRLTMEGAKCEAHRVSPSALLPRKRPAGSPAEGTLVFAAPARSLKVAVRNTDR